MAASDSPSVAGHEPGAGWTQLVELNPTRRLITLELSADAGLLGVWEFTGHDLGLAWDPEAMLHFKQGVAKMLSAVASVAARGAAVLNSWVPSLISQVTADKLRRDHTADLSLPLTVAGHLKANLDLHAPNRHLIWLAIEEPAGYIPYLNWERLLRPHVGVPIVRLPSRLVNPTTPANSLDVLMTCSTATTKTIAAPTRVVKLVKEILSAYPPPRRCVIHLFADEVYRPPLFTALTKAKIALKETGEPDGQRGVILYQHFKDRDANNEQANSHDTSEHPWGAWISRSLGGKGVDLVHVIADGDLSASIATLRVSSQPWDSTAALSESAKTLAASPSVRIPLVGKNQTGTKAIRVRYVNALQMRDFAKRVGAWATVFSSPRESARGAHRVLAHRLAQVATGVFAVHEFDRDSTGRVAGSFYKMLARDNERVDAKEGELRVTLPDSPELLLYCHPDRILCSPASQQQSMGDLFPSAHDAVQRIRQVMDVPEATPAWLAVTQRHLEDAAADWADAGVSTEEDSAAQRGVWQALSFALKAIAANSNANTQDRVGAEATGPASE